MEGKMETSGSTAESAQKPPRSAGPTTPQAASGGLKWDGNGSRGALLVITRQRQIAYLHKHSPPHAGEKCTLRAGAPLAPTLE